MSLLVGDGLGFDKGIEKGTASAVEHVAEDGYNWNSAVDDAKATDTTPGSSPQSQSNTELYNTSGPNADEPSLSDIHQGRYGDCYFLASLGALAQNDPNAVKKMIHDNGNGTYTVTFHVQSNGIQNLWGLTGDSYTTKQVTVSAKDISKYGANQGYEGPTSIVKDTNNGKQVIWPAVVEAAYAKMHDTKIFGRDLGISTGYSNIGGGGWPQPVLENLTGHDAQSYNEGWKGLLSDELFGGPLQVYKDDTELGHLKSQFDSGKLITVCTPASDGDESGYDKGNPYNLIGDHCYTVTNVYAKNGREYVSLNNPWGLDQPQDIPLSALPKVSDNIAVGTDPNSNTISANTH